MEQRIDALTSNMWGKKTEINGLFMKILKCERDQDGDGSGMNGVDMDLVGKDASNLLLMTISDYNQGGKKKKKKMKMDMNVLIEIFGKRSFNHIYFVAKQYELSSVSSLSLYEAMNGLYEETKDKIYYGIGQLLLWLTSRDEYYADLLGDSIYKNGPSYCMFLRLIVERHNIDLKTVIDKYGRIALMKWIKYDFIKKDSDAAMLVQILCGLQVTLK